MTPDRILDEPMISRPGSWVVFVGAGISVDSGIPTANDLTAEILGVLGTSAGDIRRIIEARIPFELFMETLREKLNLNLLLDIFDSHRPTATHFFLARLLASNQITTIATTNYDTLLEQALQSLGLQQSRDFVVHSSERDLKAIDWTSPRRRILKLHGCISDRDNIFLTLSRVAGRATLKAIGPVVKGLFGSNQYRGVLILGYSCSDHFDISPSIRAIGDELAEVILVQHSMLKTADWYAEPICKALPMNPFVEASNGYRVYADTRAVIRTLWKRHQNTLGLPGPRLSPLGGDTWRHLVKIWKGGEHVSKTGSLAAYVVGRLLMRSNRYVAAQAAFERSIRNTKPRQDAYLATYIQSALGVCYYRLGNISMSLRMQRTALYDARRMAIRTIEARTLGNLGNIHFTANRLILAARYQKKCLYLARTIGDQQLEANTLGNLGIIWDKKKQYQLARQYHRKASNLASKIGDIIGVSRHAYNIALAYAQETEDSAAVKWFIIAERQARLAGQDETLALCSLGKGRLLLRTGQIDDAELSLSQSLKLFGRTKEQVNVAECYEAFGDLYLRKGLRPVATRFFLRALNAAKLLHSTKRIAHLRMKIRESQGL